jgi:hypothetical protein
MGCSVSESNSEGSKPLLPEFGIAEFVELLLNLTFVRKLHFENCT